ncbi:MAG: hypothetical protein OWQ47_01440 [Acidianus infernus]|nr:hypothetical protein [Acidianus infernus]
MAAQDLAERGGADAVIVSGPRSSIPPSADTVKKVKASVNLPVIFLIAVLCSLCTL